MNNVIDALLDESGRLSHSDHFACSTGRISPKKLLGTNDCLRLAINRAKLKAALEHRCADWRARLRSEHPQEARYVVQQLVGPLELWVGSRKQEREKEKALAALGVTADDSRGKENIEWSDCGFAGTLSPLGLLSGLCALNMVAGAGFEPATFGL
jgi:hypothetical protein